MQPRHRSRFDELFEEAVPSILEDAHVCDVVPQGGGRWPLSAALLPGPCQGQDLTQILEELLPSAGSHHFLTGHRAALHITVRALEHRREHVPAHDPAVTRYLGAIQRTAEQSPPLRLHITGLTLTTSGVMAAINPVDGRADQMAALFASELGKDAWREVGMHRTIWYSTLLHFTGPISRPADLVSFVADRRHLDLGIITADRLSLVHFEHTAEHDGPQYMRPHELGASPFSGT